MSAQVDVCDTCNGRGEVGGWVGQTAENAGWDSVPCPDCDRQVAPAWQNIETAEVEFLNNLADKGGLADPVPGMLRHCARLIRNRPAIAELIAADREYDDARARLNVPMPNGEVDAALDKLEAATARRASALAAVGGSK